LDSFAAIKNALGCTAFVDTTTPENLGQSTDALASHGMQDWQTCHSGGASFLIVQFDTTDHAATAKSDLADGTNTWSYSWSDSVFVLFMIHTNAVDLAKQTFGDQGAGPGATASSPGSAPSASGLSVTGSVPYRTAEGYTFTLGVQYSAGPGVLDVGSNPPGKTDIAFASATFSGTITDTTEGGRSIPSSVIGGGDFAAISLVAIYPAKSAACKLVADGGGFADVAGAGYGLAGGAVNGRTCYVVIQPVLGSPAANGALGGTIESGTPVTYTFNALAVAATLDNDAAVKAVPESSAAELASALNDPLGYGLLDFKGSFTPTDGAQCSYPAPSVGYGSDGRVVVMQGSSSSALAPC